MKSLRALAASALLTASAFAGLPAEESAPSPITWGSDLVFDAVALPQSSAIEWNFEGALWIEADLGPLVHLDDWYIYVHPTPTWGAEEDYRWTARLYQAWLSWDGAARWNLLVGLYDLGWHFHSMPSTAAFNRLPGQNSGSFSPGGLGLLDLYPLSVPAARLEWKPIEGFSVQAAALWLGAGQDLASHQLVSDLSGSQRWMAIAEATWERDGTEENRFAHRRAGLGGWFLPAAELNDGKHSPWGAYTFADLRIWSEPGDAEQGVSVFASASIAAQRRGPLEKRAVAGTQYVGLFPNRPADQTALAIVAEESGATTDDEGHRHWDVAVQLLHRVQLGEHAYLQSSVLWRQTPTDDADNAGWKIGLTLGLSF